MVHTYVTKDGKPIAKLDIDGLMQKKHTVKSLI